MGSQEHGHTSVRVSKSRSRIDRSIGMLPMYCAAVECVVVVVVVVRRIHLEAGCHNAVTVTSVFLHNAQAGRQHTLTG
jgi:hypothetical protein